MVAEGKREKKKHNGCQERSVLLNVKDRPLAQPKSKQPQLRTKEENDAPDRAAEERSKDVLARRGRRVDMDLVLKVRRGHGLQQKVRGG